MSIQKITRLVCQLADAASSQAVVAMSGPPGKPRHKLIPFVPAFLQLGRLAYGVELSYQAIRRATQDIEKEKRAKPEFFMGMRRSHHAHSLFSCSHSFWTLLRDIGRKGHDETIISMIEKYESAIEEAEAARHHFEHLPERIFEGRSKKWSRSRPTMDKATLWKAVAKFQGESIQFGDEAFSYGRARSEILNSMDELVPYVCEKTKITVTVRHQGRRGDER